MNQAIQPWPDEFKEGFKEAFLKPCWESDEARMIYCGLIGLSIDKIDKLNLQQARIACDNLFINSRCAATMSHNEQCKELKRRSWMFYRFAQDLSFNAPKRSS